MGVFEVNIVLTFLLSRYSTGVYLMSLHWLDKVSKEFGIA